MQAGTCSHSTEKAHKAFEAETMFSNCSCNSSLQEIALTGEVLIYTEKCKHAHKHWKSQVVIYKV